jgi:pimeloyl-ACP methyl ester carboxylesterase
LFTYSADGTRIGYRRLGTGPAVVFVHGSVSTHTDWMPAAKLLSTRFTCYVMDRRGRRGSGFGHGTYSIEREYEDIEAVLAVAGPGAMLAGHSYGAVCAMGAALRYTVPKLVLYEPPLPVGGPIAGAHLADYARAVEANEYERAMEIGLKHFTRLRPEVIAAIRGSRGWPRLVHLAPTWTRELIAMDAQAASVEGYRALSCPVLLLVGTLSTEHPMQNSARALAAALPDVRVASLEGQDHLGLRGAPEQVAHHVGNFLSA